MTKRLRAVLVVAAVLIAGALGASESIDLPTRGSEGYRSPWRDGAKVLHVEELGEHYALLTIRPSRVVDSISVTERAGGEYVGQRTVILLADEVGLARLGDTKPTRAWWDKVIGIRRGAPLPKLETPRLPSAEDGRTGAWP